MVEKNDTWEQENVFLFEFGIIVPAILKCLFRHNFCRRSLSPAEKLPLFRERSLIIPGRGPEGNIMGYENQNLKI